MICFAAIVAHPVSSIPAINKGVDAQLTGTSAAFKQIKQELYASKPDTLLVVSPHVKGPAGTLTLNQNRILTVTFHDFGDLTPHGSFTSNIGLGYQLRQLVETSVPLITIESGELDHGSSVPLFHLLDTMSQIPIISVGTAHEVDLIQHFTCGQYWRKPLELTNERVAILISADLTHDLKDQSTADSQAFDSKIIHWIENQDIKALLALPNDNTLVQSVCGLRPIVLLLGILQGKAFSVQSLSYERALGIGYYSAFIRVR
ncbi:MAG: hypothetical protein V1846_02510 [Candidatus Komeilibacteria bacterium]